jgi:hypothetical protein
MTGIENEVAAKPASSVSMIPVRFNVNCTSGFVQKRRSGCYPVR